MRPRSDAEPLRRRLDDRAKEPAFLGMGTNVWVGDPSRIDAAADNDADARRLIAHGSVCPDQASELLVGTTSDQPRQLLNGAGVEPFGMESRVVGLHRIGDRRVAELDAPPIEDVRGANGSGE